MRNLKSVIVEESLNSSRLHCIWGEPRGCFGDANNRREKWSSGLCREGRKVDLEQRSREGNIAKKWDGRRQCVVYRNCDIVHSKKDKGKKTGLASMLIHSIFYPGAFST